MDFTDKVVLVTGASKGIGRGTAEAFAKHGSYITITGRNQADLDEVEKSCRNKGAKDVQQINVDFTDVAAVKTIVEKVVAKFKRLDILINNAGAAAFGNLSIETEENFDHLFAVNVKSLLFVTQKAMPYLVDTKGCIVNISSISSVECEPSMLTYGMTKAALDYFTKTVALEYAPKGVRVNSVNPGVVRTTIMVRSAGEEAVEDFMTNQAPKFHPLGRIGTIDEVAKTILFLASEDSAWTTGHCLFVDGGKKVRSAH